MKKKNTKRTILTGSIIAGALLTFSVTTNARPLSQVMGSGAEVRTEIIDLNINSSVNNLLELKCGAEEGSSKKAEAKPVKTSKKEGKATEAKCGEGKCGSDDDKKSEKKTTKAEVKTEKKEKTSEAKCGEGKCGAE